ncbi:MAG: YibE/F family protein [Patescibacteria group bacterium]|nr:YibE/F family protein [Patescibacteria group bacterium]
MKKILVLIVFLLTLIKPSQVFGQDDYYKGEVFWMIRETEVDKGVYEQEFKVKILDEELKDKEVIIKYEAPSILLKEQLYKVGDKVILQAGKNVDGEIRFMVSDRIRSKSLIILSLIYAIAIIGLAKFKGFKSLIGLGLSFLVVVKFIVPQILSGANPLLVSILGSMGIVSMTLYLIYGFKKQTTVSLISTLLSLFLTGIIALLVTKITQLTGLGSDEAMYLQVSQQSISSMKGLLLGGIMIGALGVIDDITVTQAAIVFELKKANQKLGIKELYKRGLEVGKDHIASMTNTLVLAYTGASLPLFLLFYSSEVIPSWVAINSEIIVEEVVSTLVGSLGLVASVPIVTYLAALVVCKYKN